MKKKEEKRNKHIKRIIRNIIKYEKASLIVSDIHLIN